MSTLLQDLLAIRNTVNEDEIAGGAKPEEGAETTNPVASEPVADAPPAAPAANPEDKEVVDEEYEDSASFQEDFDSLDTHIENFNKIINSQKFMHWCTETDKNFSVSVTPLIETVKEHLTALTEATKAFKEEMYRAE